MFCAAQDVFRFAVKLCVALAEQQLDIVRAVAEAAAGFAEQVVLAASDATIGQADIGSGQKPTSSLVAIGRFGNFQLARFSGGEHRLKPLDRNVMPLGNLQQHSPLALVDLFIGQPGLDEPR